MLLCGNEKMWGNPSVGVATLVSEVDAWPVVRPTSNPDEFATVRSST